MLLAAFYMYLAVRLLGVSAVVKAPIKDGGAKPPNMYFGVAKAPPAPPAPPPLRCSLICHSASMVYSCLCWLRCHSASVVYSVPACLDAILFQISDSQPLAYSSFSGPQQYRFVLLDHGVQNSGILFSHNSGPP